MLSRLATIRPAAWIIVVAVTLLGIINTIAAAGHWLPPATLTYAVQPAGAVALAVLAMLLTGHQRERVRHANDRAIIVASAMAIWFVFYFATGILTTYTANALVTTPIGLILNVIGFGVTAAALESARHRAMLAAGRRDTLWFSLIVVAAFAINQMSLSHLTTIQTAPDLIKFIIADTIPAIVASVLLTYLSMACGLIVQLTYRLGVVAMAIFPPIIPKYDWYLLGLSSILLSMLVYLVVDHAQRERHSAGPHHHAHRAFDTMWVITMIALTLFVSGALSYKPSAIMSNSMDPTFSRGSVVIVQKISSVMDINVGDIIQYKAHDASITHRVIAITQSGDGNGKRVFTTKGDNNPGRDAPVNEDQVTGIVTAQIPYIGYPTVWLHETTMGNKGNEINKVGN